MVRMFKLEDRSAEFHRENKTIDLVKRIGVITADRVYLTNYPVNNPVMVFNPSICIENDDLKIYGRMVLGYFTYASAVLELIVPIGELEEISGGHYSGRIVVKPDNKYDIWGVEDPRVCIINGKEIMTYCGRTVNYFSSAKITERTVPVIAVKEKGKKKQGWIKTGVFKMLGDKIVSDKDAFLVEMNRLKLFHRIHTLDNEFYCIISDVERTVLERDEFKEIEVSDAIIALKAAKFEEKIGWGSPPIKIRNEYLMLVHAIDRETKWYKIFAVLMDENAEVTAVTPYYIMEPKENYEVYGDRPFTVFPCGMCRLDDKLLISYGAADSAAGIGEIDLIRLMEILDSNRI